MATSSQAFVTDLLVQKFQGLGLEIDGVPVPVYDGPEGPNEDDNYVVIMGWPGQTSASQMKWAYMGTMTRYEDYDLAVMVFSWVGGDNADASWDASDAQATARAHARYIESAIEASLLADPNLSEQNNGTPAVIWVLLQSSRLDQTPPDEESAMGRFAQYALKVQVKNVLSGV